MISIQQLGFDEIRKSLLRIAPEVRREVVAQMAQEVYVKAQDAADLHTKTGRLVRSLKKRKLDGGESIEIYHDAQIAPHAVFVHWGTRPHVIKPKDKKALRWAGQNGFNFAKIVHHPGYRGDPYLVKARDAIATNFSRLASDAWDAVRRRIFP